MVEFLKRDVVHYESFLDAIIMHVNHSSITTPVERLLCMGIVVGNIIRAQLVITLLRFCNAAILFILNLPVNHSFCFRIKIDKIIVFNPLDTFSAIHVSLFIKGCKVLKRVHIRSIAVGRLDFKRFSE